ncbi:hypothetical protein [Xenorhabdus sp. KJ12.1]|nr:hypothetical protein [Xenorhabdus sp. KJ12.1]
MTAESIDADLIKVCPAEVLKVSAVNPILFFVSTDSVNGAVTSLTFSS